MNEKITGIRAEIAALEQKIAEIKSRIKRLKKKRDGVLEAICADRKNILIKFD